MLEVRVPVETLLFRFFFLAGGGDEQFQKTLRASAVLISINSDTPLPPDAERQGSEELAHHPARCCARVFSRHPFGEETSLRVQQHLAQLLVEQIDIVNLSQIIWSTFEDFKRTHPRGPLVKRVCTMKDFRAKGLSRQAIQVRG